MQPSPSGYTRLTKIIIADGSRAAFRCVAATHVIKYTRLTKIIIADGSLSAALGCVGATIPIRYTRLTLAVCIVTIVVLSAFKAFPLYRGYGLLVRVFPFNVLETTIMDEEHCGYENPYNEEPLAVWMTLKTQQ